MSKPIACSLSASEYRRRAAEIRALLRDALVSREPIAGGERLTFTADAGVYERVTELMAAETECCPFLSMELTLALEVTQPEEP